jgi:hypothetical protein
MIGAEKIAAAILAAAAIKDLPGVRFNTVSLEDLYRHFLRVATDPRGDAGQPRAVVEGYGMHVGEVGAWRRNPDLASRMKPIEVLSGQAQREETGKPDPMLDRSIAPVHK